MILEELGWNSFFENSSRSEENNQNIYGRVICIQRHIYHVACESGEAAARISGKFLHDADVKSEYPVVGDWVSMTLQEHTRTNELYATIHSILSRQNFISRNVAGTGNRYSGGVTMEQVIAANVSTIFIVCGLDREYNLRRIERYLTFLYESAAKPVIVLNKADLCDNTSKYVSEVESVAFEVPVHVLSASKNDGIEDLRKYLKKGETIALLGSSGVGKSTIINKLIGYDRQRVNDISSSVNKGTHTTTHRELIRIPSGGMIIDNPGMRELQLWCDEDALKNTFTDVEMFADSCRFNNCRHENEPGCAVIEALENGDLDEKHFNSYLKLRKELKFLASRQNNQLKAVGKKRGKMIKNMLNGKKVY